MNHFNLPQGNWIRRKTTTLFKEWLDAIIDLFYEGLSCANGLYDLINHCLQKSELGGILEDILGWTEDLIDNKLIKLETCDEINAKYDAELAAHSNPQARTSQSLNHWRLILLLNKKKREELEVLLAFRPGLTARWSSMRPMAAANAIRGAHHRAFRRPTALGAPRRSVADRHQRHQQARFGDAVAIQL